MSEMKTLSVQKRTGMGKGSNRRLRQQAIVTGVYYNAKGDNIPVQMPALPLQKIYGQVGRTNVFNLEIDDAGIKTLYPVFVWAAQYHPVKSVFTHIDFMGVNLDKEVKINVPLEFVGVAKGVKLGGVLEVYREIVTLRAKPQQMPRKVIVDLTALDMNQSIQVADLQLDAGVSSVTQGDFVIAAVTSAKAEIAAEEEAV